MQYQSIVVAIFSLFGVLLGGGLQYLFGRALESQRQLTLQRSESYVDYFKALALARNDRSREILSMAADAKARICLYGSINVIECLYDFEAAGANTNSSNGQDAIIRLLKEMRTDIRKNVRFVNESHLREVLFGSNPSSLSISGIS